MWANEEVAALAEWLRNHNRGVPDEQKVGFYGLDVYSLWDSLYAVMSHLQRTDPSLLAAAKHAYRCFEPYGEDVQEYARATTFVPTSCEDEGTMKVHSLKFNGVKAVDESRLKDALAKSSALAA